MFASGGSLVTKTPVSISQGSGYFPWMPPMSTHGWPSAYAGIYGRHLWVNVVVSKRARGTARLPLPVYERNELDRPRRDDHPMAQLLANPNPGMTGFDLWLWTSSTFDIYGDTAWLKRRSRGRVTGIFPLHPSSLSYDDGVWNFDNGKLRLSDIPESDLVLFRNFNPDSLKRGLSPLEPLRSTLENEWSARVATSSFWKRGARPAMALVHPNNLSEAASVRLKTQFDDVAAGADKTGVTVVLEEGMEPKPMTLTAEEAQYIETRKLNREEVCAAYDIPPPVVHILDHATFSNITEQMRSMYRDTMAPHLKGFEATIERDLRRAEWPDDNVYAEFLMDDVLRGDFETRQDALAKATHMTIAEKRKVENLPFIEGTDRIFLNTATLPLDAIDAQADAIRGTTPTPGDEELAEVIPLAAARSILGRLAWQRSLADVNLASLVEGMDDRDAAAVTKALDLELEAGGSVKSLRKRLSGMGVKMARFKAAPEDSHVDTVREVLVRVFGRQRAAVIESGNFDPEAWNDVLAGDLHAAAVTISASVGKAAVRALGYDPEVYDTERTVAFLEAVSARLAGNVNTTTAAKLAEADEPATVFDVAEDSRAVGIASGAATLFAGFATLEAGKRIGEASGKAPKKRWVTGSNPRPSHAAMNGQTVPVDEAFSNGMQFPHDPGSADEVAGCNCTVEIEV